MLNNVLTPLAKLLKQREWFITVRKNNGTWDGYSPFYEARNTFDNRASFGKTRYEAAKKLDDWLLKVYGERGGEVEIMGEISVLSSNGDDKILWDCNSKEEIDNAEKQFEAFKGKDYTFFKCDKDGNQLGEMKKFDALAEFIIAIPPTRKG